LSLFKKVTVFDRRRGLREERGLYAGFSGRVMDCVLGLYSGTEITRPVRGGQGVRNGRKKERKIGS